ncbi:hypothetical protein BDP27DRAFT_1419010 [Rhodocollybia butyracea]|uniref:Uncharacterized protein n=1 Tax=Rhodocollybia butyracea TaxID=206335 RepID=A0A9P5U9X9_9AGAR|nr:hypothetical protein BDP27DRAFT_1419010 [Rhodocollybia butyracea]
MFFTRHSLGFVLLAFLISPACAMPTLERRDATKYTVTVFDERGKLVSKVATEALQHIKASINAMGPSIKDPGPKNIVLAAGQTPDAEMEFDPTIRIHYKLFGGKFCDFDEDGRECYAYVITSHYIMLGSVVAGKDGHVVEEAHNPLHDSHAQSILDREYLAFLTEFPLVEPWVLAMKERQTEASITVRNALGVLIMRKHNIHLPG